MDKEIRKRVLGQVQACTRSMVGGSAHLAGYEVLPDTFKITKVEEIQVGLKKYIFEVKGYRESEFTIYDEHCQPVAE